MYNIFQPILSVDQAMNAEIDTYEMLIRNNNGEFPGINFLHSLTTQEGNDAWIKASRKSLKNALNEQQNRKIYINLEPCQMKFESIWQFLEEIREAYHDHVAIEITERRETIHSLDYLDREIQRLKEMGFELAIDDVCAGSNSYAFIKRQLKVVSRIKLSLLLFKDEDYELMISFVNAWLAFAKKHHLTFVIEGISNRQLAKKFAGNPVILQQGFYWGKGTAHFNSKEKVD
ncbi:EAL domain-containing protein [Limosilactobacillus reuteri]|uniref:EAL domain-containing protein n=1 Tax=Limosilactobacillus reuteri TaxID=1598 RepID=UPI00081BD56B|nr:EAL domain-containing protein [Limosilactobacillus reuteri]MCH5380369.1 EAL domain-containing protein [Limosilactobacillus reuteri]OCW63381.1 diguanylate phosphodiesterase [Limosilactobacillus reuteri]OCW64577.1 diguanylate phosphodiesterase [Limosilactobacillus reuteri]OCW64862.1 diguanylate phosphodiesterase [Limosilactobacillus reuteri]OCW68199.1 diguanylate phosphodiesterase [Limosilactobacillus reuteri]